jgi:Raf kinase inhibitor-like YbhB/YbcL family protein
MPAGTKSIALVVDDSDAPITPYVYWVVFDIRPGTSAMLEGQLPPGARQARGTAGHARYDPPCPGPGGHSYRFTVYALDSVLHLPDGAPLQDAWQAIAAATIGRGRLVVNATSPLPQAFRPVLSGLAALRGELSRFARQAGTALVTILRTSAG